MSLCSQKFNYNEYFIKINCFNSITTPTWKLLITEIYFGNELIGSSRVAIDTYNPFKAYLEMIKVEYTYRRRNLGSLLIYYSKELAKQNGASEMVVQISPIDNESLETISTFYKKNGFIFIFDKFAYIEL